MRRRAVTPLLVASVVVAYGATASADPSVFVVVPEHRFLQYGSPVLSILQTTLETAQRQLGDAGGRFPLRDANGDYRLRSEGQVDCRAPVANCIGVHLRIVDGGRSPSLSVARVTSSLVPGGTAEVTHPDGDEPWTMVASVIGAVVKLPEGGGSGVGPCKLIAASGAFYPVCEGLHARYAGIATARRAWTDVRAWFDLVASDLTVSLDPGPRPLPSTHSRAIVVRNGSLNLGEVALRDTVTGKRASLRVDASKSTASVLASADWSTQRQVRFVRVPSSCAYSGERFLDLGVATRDTRAPDVVWYRLPCAAASFQASKVVEVLAYDVSFPLDIPVQKTEKPAQSTDKPADESCVELELTRRETLPSAIVTCERRRGDPPDEFRFRQLRVWISPTLLAPIHEASLDLDGRTCKRLDSGEEHACERQDPVSFSCRETASKVLSIRMKKPVCVR